MDKYTVKELRSKARNMGLSGYSSLKKDNLVKMIEKSKGKCSSASVKRRGKRVKTPTECPACMESGKRMVRCGHGHAQCQDCHRGRAKAILDPCNSTTRFYGVTVSTQDSESCDPSSNLGRT